MGLPEKKQETKINTMLDEVGTTQKVAERKGGKKLNKRGERVMGEKRNAVTLANSRME